MTLPELVELRSAIDAYTIIEVRRQRALGKSWAAIGGLLGVSAQSAHTRYYWIERSMPDAPTTENKAQGR